MIIIGRASFRIHAASRSVRAANAMIAPAAKKSATPHVLCGQSAIQRGPKERAIRNSGVSKMIAIERRKRPWLETFFTMNGHVA
jgi:hypothetical protein